MARFSTMFSWRFAPSSPFRKNNSLLVHPKSALEIPPSHPSRGADRESSRTRGGMRWTQQRRREACSQGGLSVSEQQRADERRFRFVNASTDLLIPAKPLERRCAYGKTVWSWHPWLMLRLAGDASAQPGRVQSSIREATVAKRIRRRGEHGISRQTIAQGMPACSGCTCMLVCASLTLIAHETAGAASTRHSLLPHFRGKGISANLGRSAPREGEVIFTNADANKFAMPGKGRRPA